MEKSTLRQRLEALAEVDYVFPTSPTGRADRGERLEGIASALEEKDFSTAYELSYLDAREVMRRDVRVQDAGLARILEVDGAAEQLAAFARAGYNFFFTDAGYASETLEQRRSAGGNGAVKRVLSSENSILLETQRLIVGFADGVGENVVRDVLDKFQLFSLRQFAYERESHQVLAEKASATEISLELLKLDVVDYAEPDFIEYVGTRSLTTDLLSSGQWHHQTLGLDTVWPSETGDGVRIAIVDNGFEFSHPALALEIPGTGWFRPTPDGDDAIFVAGTTGMPVGSHGTACVGMAAGVPEPPRRGVAFGTNVRAIACLPDQIGTQLTLARALAVAAQPMTESLEAAGADVIACSLGPSSSFRWQMRRILSDAIDFVTTRSKDGRGIPLFWAVTNGNYPISGDEVSSHPRVIAIGRSTRADTDDGSGFGPELDFLAPGVDVMLPTTPGRYRAMTGTSYACPCAAAVAAIALQRRPGLTAEEVRNVMRDSCCKVGNLPYTSGRNDYFGFGRVDAAALMAAL
ncbi:S8 family peptidase [Mycobacterium intracellulare]|uniref:S8 family peptidase n=1 Tax=Mycobacterium intracellulare TaxID=1767 RepID=UPI001447F366|nr:S8 family serine peptidase [Mycobacterium intracellulare]